MNISPEELKKESLESLKSILTSHGGTTETFYQSAKAQVLNDDAIFKRLVEEQYKSQLIDTVTVLQNYNNGEIKALEANAEIQYDGFFRDSYKVKEALLSLHSQDEKLKELKEQSWKIFKQQVLHQRLVPLVIRENPSLQGKEEQLLQANNRDYVTQTAQQSGINLADMSNFINEEFKGKQDQHIEQTLAIYGKLVTEEFKKLKIETKTFDKNCLQYFDTRTQLELKIAANKYVEDGFIKSLKDDLALPLRRSTKSAASEILAKYQAKSKEYEIELEYRNSFEPQKSYHDGLTFKIIIGDKINPILNTLRKRGLDKNDNQLRFNVLQSLWKEYCSKNKEEIEEFIEIAHSESLLNSAEFMEAQLIKQSKRPKLEELQGLFRLEERYTSFDYKNELIQALTGKGKVPLKDILTKPNFELLDGIYKLKVLHRVHTDLLRVLSGEDQSDPYIIEKKQEFDKLRVEELITITYQESLLNNARFMEAILEQNRKSKRKLNKIQEVHPKEGRLNSSDYKEELIHELTNEGKISLENILDQSKFKSLDEKDQSNILLKVYDDVLEALSKENQKNPNIVEKKQEFGKLRQEMVGKISKQTADDIQII